jgi:hypothetical protein
VVGAGRERERLGVTGAPQACRQLVAILIEIVGPLSGDEDARAGDVIGNAPLGGVM